MSNKKTFKQWDAQITTDSHRPVLTCYSAFTKLAIDEAKRVALLPENERRRIWTEGSWLNDY